MSVSHFAETHEREVVHLVPVSGNRAYAQDRNDRDQEAAEDVEKSVAFDYGADEVASSLYAHARQEECKTYLAKHMVRADCSVGHELHPVAET